VADAGRDEHRFFRKFLIFSPTLDGLLRVFATDFRQSKGNAHHRCGMSVEKEFAFLFLLLGTCVAVADQEPHDPIVAVMAEQIVDAKFRHAVKRVVMGMDLPITPELNGVGCFEQSEKLFVAAARDDVIGNNGKTIEIPRVVDVRAAKDFSPTGTGQFDRQCSEQRLLVGVARNRFGELLGETPGSQSNFASLQDLQNQIGVDAI
jgi:hypothetical protein